MLELKNINLIYENNTVLKDINFTFYKDKRYAIIGKSGCGKTSLLKIITKLNKDYTGEIKGDIKTSIVFQEPRLFYWLSVLENVMFSRCSLKTALRLLKLCGLSHAKKLYPKELSGGMKARASFARALGYKHDILLLDEPFSSLDYFNARELRFWLKDILTKEQKGLILVTHNIEEALFLADYIVVLHKSKLIQIKNENLKEEEILNYFKE